MKGNLKSVNYTVVIVSSGRAQILRDTVEDVLTQTVSPSEIILSTIKQDDWVGQNGDDTRIRHIYGRRGIPVQLNAALDMLSSDVEYFIVFDDDVALPTDYCERALSWLIENLDIIALDGTDIRDGGINRFEADALLNKDRILRPHTFKERDKLYGCNMCARKIAFERERFDEKLEGYAWLFELDWAMRLKQYGRVGRAADCRMVHLMAESGRAPGYKLGYMQVMNPYYLYRKGILPVRELFFPFIWKHIAINLYKTLSGDKKIDRWGRLRGNLLGLRDIFFRRPRRRAQD